MAFLETPRFPGCVSFGAVSGPNFSTVRTVVSSGYDDVLIRYEQPLHRYTFEHANRTQVEHDELLKFFMVVKGMGHRFRVKDYTDYVTLLADGVLRSLHTGSLVGVSGQGYGTRDYVLQKRYANSLTDQQTSIVSHTVGTSHIFTMSPAFSPALAIGQLIYVTGITGTAATVLNGLWHTITNVASADYTVATNTAGLTASGGVAYSESPLVTYRNIYKPVTDLYTVYRNGIAATIGTGVGQYTITDGKITFGADQTQSISSHTVGASHQITLGVAFSPNVAIGKRVFITGVAGTAATTLNSLSHRVTAVSGTLITLETNTAGLTATLGSAYLYPQASETLTWAGEFDVPCRFLSDEASFEIVEKTGDQDLLYSWSGINLTEVRFALT